MTRLRPVPYYNNNNNSSSSSSIFHFVQRILRPFGAPSMVILSGVVYFFSPVEFIDRTSIDKAVEFLSISNEKSIGSSRKQYRRVSIDLGDGNCQWTDAQPLGEGANPYGTLFASYPASGMRVAWQQTEGITGIQVGDDFHLGGEQAYDKVGLIKTQYPHFEGIWTFRANVDQVVLVLRNPRWAIPSYHTLLHELEYAHDWETAYEYLYDTFTKRPPLENWWKWRDYRFADEINLWKWHIDFYMGNGTQYWTDLDFERNGQWPFRFLNETEMAAGKRDPHCLYDVANCVPAALISYEKLKTPGTGVGEVIKVANVLRGQREMTVINESAIACVYEETWLNAKFPQNDMRSGLPPAAYKFTWDQMVVINQTLHEVVEKYSVGEWTDHPIAMELVDNLENYINSTLDEMEFMIENPGPPTMAPGVNYTNEIREWYQGLGRGNRYAKAAVQALASYWPYVRCLYDDNEECEPLNATSGVLDLIRNPADPSLRRSE